ncbi:succinate dehydrogenase, hydrophobic membrane anchor protein [Haloactinomyces albus]|uniref:Succinate dehydrogenase hydrophobic membrane anchor subunit n=1 Tax=Haloactinomyces albus TaxID=1352928 RepID=A0AAE3ZFJ7_9ACTN|nr:succinate dehydrogenase, hydrophobic membrane anchor protein [Haloactinomyces albus]MDR7302629.1 succinate dehydrogenase / fumarate reductase membrane anchor subunit [Haloactinomyces albus]
MTTTEAPVAIDKPRSSTRPAARRSNFELYSWVFMRLSGVVLLFLVLGHLLIMLFLDGGVQRINFAFVAGRWASPFWQMWDLTMLWLAGLHGANGLRTVINDYSRKGGTRFWLQTLLCVSLLVIVVLGTFVLFTFDPNIS